MNKPAQQVLPAHSPGPDTDPQHGATGSTEGLPILQIKQWPRPGAPAVGGS